MGIQLTHANCSGSADHRSNQIWCLLAAIRPALSPPTHPETESYTFLLVLAAAVVKWHDELTFRKNLSKRTGLKMSHAWFLQEKIVIFMEPSPDHRESVSVAAYEPSSDQEKLVVDEQAQPVS